MLTEDERLALLVAVDKQLQPQLKEAKSLARGELMQLADECGADRRAIKVDGRKVGEVGVTYSKAKPFIVDMQAAIPYLRDMGLTEEKPKDGWEESFAKAGNDIICTETGEVVPFLAWEPERVKAATVRGCKPQEVLEAMAGKLEGTNPLALLTEG